MMDVSPYPAPSFGRTPQSSCSHSATPSSHKRLREEDIAQLMAEPPLKQQEPWSSPKRNSMSSDDGHGAGAPNAPGSGGPSSSAMCVTPIAGFTTNSATAALEMGVRWAVHQRQGPRANQEDAAVARMDESSFPHAYFAVYDGHGGSVASEYCATSLHANVMNSDYMPALVPALQDGFLRTDAELLKTFSTRRGKGNDQGTAAVVTLVTDAKLITAWAGDCRALLVKRSSSPIPYVELSRDHSAEHVEEYGAGPMRPDEVERVEKAGARMDPGGYVCVHDHSLPMTRALGDLPLKVGPSCDWRTAPVDAQVVTARPEVGIVDRSPDDLCIVLASDGLFGQIMSSAEVAAIAREQLEVVHANAQDAEKRTAVSLCDYALCEKNGCDNVSVVVVALDAPLPMPPLNPTSGGDGVANLLSGMLPSFPPNPTSLGAGSSSRHASSSSSASHHLNQPLHLAWMDKSSTLSQDSIGTADTASFDDTTSPGRLPFDAKMLMRFCDAYANELADDGHASRRAALNGRC